MSIPEIHVYVLQCPECEQYFQLGTTAHQHKDGSWVQTAELQRYWEQERFRKWDRLIADRKRFKDFTEAKMFGPGSARMAAVKVILNAAADLHDGKATEAEFIAFLQGLLERLDDGRDKQVESLQNQLAEAVCRMPRPFYQKPNQPREKPE